MGASDPGTAPGIYWVASTDSYAAPRPLALFCGPPHHEQPGGTLHAVHRVTVKSACGVALEDLYRFEDVDWRHGAEGKCAVCLTVAGT
jgi:hypothetical protein